MAIKRMISRDPAEFRAFQSRMTTVGKIRLGVYETPPGQRGRPKKIDTFRFTSENKALIQAVADAYGGEVRPWTPQGSKTAEWEVISATDAIPVYIVNGQDLDPWYEAWAGGRTCVRRCDGIVNKITQELCVCIPADGTPSKLPAKELCKPTTRAQVMLAEIQGLGSWMLESHGENAARGLSVFREFIAAAPMPVPAMLRLDHQSRRQWNFEKKKFDSLDFYVPWFDISKINAETIAIGGDALTQALAAAGAPAIGGGTQMAIEARPVSAPVPAPAAPAPFDIEVKRPMILADIEACTTVEALETLKLRLIDRGITDLQVRQAWASKLAGVQARDAVEGPKTTLVDASLGGRPYRVLVTGSRTWTDVEELEKQLSFAQMTHRGRMVLVHGACPTGADALADAWAEANGVPVERYPANWNGPDGKAAGFKRNQAMVDSRPDIVLSFNRGESRGTEHCTQRAEIAGLKVLRFTDDTPVVDRDAVAQTLAGVLTSEAQAVGLIERAEAVLPPEKAAELRDIVEGAVETTGPVLPDVPEGDYDADELYTMIATGAGQQNPPLTTPEVNALIVRATGMQPNVVTGHALAQLRAGLKAGTVAWR